MFERYTEKARRVIFFARYEASQYGTPAIEAEHLLLGLLRENKQFANQTLQPEVVEAIRSKIDARFPVRESTPTSVDLPLSEESKHVLKYAADEADQLGHKHIGTEHLLLGLLRNKGIFAAELLYQQGLDIDALRGKLASAYETRSVVSGEIYVKRSAITQNTIELHGSSWSADYMRDAVQEYRAISWHWHLRPWALRDAVIHRDSGKISFDLSLAQDTANFDLVPGGWKQEHCVICRWTILTSDDPSHNSGYTNGRDWLCTECYEKFFKGPDYFSSNHPEIT